MMARRTLLWPRVLFATLCVGGNFAWAAPASEVIPIEFQTQNGWTYDGRIELPPEEKRRPWAVMLVGGGMGSDIDWLVPGIMTLDGKPTRDADTIAKALLERGWVVMRWQAIRRGDSQFDESGLMMDVDSFGQTLEQTRNALAAFRAKKVVPDDHIFLLGHSLGALRAAALISDEDRFPGIVMLAGASLIPSDLAAAREIVQEADADFAQRGGDALAAEHDAFVVKALTEKRETWLKPVANERTKHGTLWPVDILARSKTPALLVVGSLDERWRVECYLVADYLRRQNHPDYEWQIYRDLGHQLGPQEPGEVLHEKFGVIANSRTGPISIEVVERLADWIDHRAK